ncbi:hypothetical protein N658DRAFT_501788 [Parathielavia hyrcaniae]|uniref:Uncharacterized protein n=1 Tax=Parathielavia hyrcaniae TaxID=113614 RepID=A0AAN6PVS7_9PEZI|nr:hypothetical protein N658DRAFT_501788 [Parathielavia hyrcaniae]
MDGEAHVNGREEGQQQAFSVEVQEETEGIVTGGDDGSAVNLIWSTDDEQPYRQLSVEDSEEDVLDAQTPANQLDEEAQPPQPPSDLEKLPNGHHQDGEEQDQPADDNEEPTDAGTSVHSHEQATEPTELPKMNRDKKIKTITTGQSQAGGSGSSSEREPWSSFRKPPKIILSSSFTPSAAAAAAAAAAASSSDKQTLDSALEHDGYTSSDSVSHDQLHFNDWRLHQVRTRTFATNPLVTQYWHWVTETKEKENSKEIEHQVLEGVEPPRWAVFKKPYNFHLKLDDIQEVKFAAAGRGR